MVNLLNLVWSNRLIPSEETPVVAKTFAIYPDGLSVPGTRSIDRDEKDLCDLPDRRAIRSMSRASIMLSGVCLEGNDKIATIVKANAFDMGIYCAINHGPEDYQCAKDLLDTPPAEFAVRYKKSRSPKHYLKQLPNLAPAQLGIFLGIMGPVNTFNHSTEAAYQALDHAEFDLNTGKVQAALVCSSFSLEDPLLSVKTRAEAPKNTVLTEGAVAFLFTGAKSGGKSYISLLEMLRNSLSTDYYGIADPLMNLFRKEN
jgi:hypothetical protein